MDSLPQQPARQRAPRVRLTGVTPAVLRSQDGKRTSGRLEVLSLTGGLVSLSNPLVLGSRVRLMFLTGAGSVLGGAEMLNPVSSTLQPFRFTSLASDDQHRLGATVQAALHPSEPQWMEKLRAASTQGSTTRRRRIKLAGALGLIAAGLVGALYLLRWHWPR